MQINSSASYPYPIWGWYEDFNGEKPSGERKISMNNIDDTFVLEYKVTTQNQGINKLIETGQAIYQYVVECPKTYFLMHSKTKETFMKMDIPCSHVINWFKVKVLIIAVKEIENCTFLDVNEDFEGCVSYPKGAVIGYIDEFTVPLSARDDVTDLSKIIKIMPSNIDNVKNDISGTHIIIKVPRNYFSIFNSYEGLYGGVFDATLVYNALVQAVMELKEHIDEEDEKDWVFYLKQYITENVEEVDNIEDVNDSYNISEAFLIVDKILNNPQLRALEDINNIINQGE